MHSCFAIDCLLQLWEDCDLRISNGCQVQIENSVKRVTITVIPNDGIFNSYRTTIVDFFFLHSLPSTIVFKYRNVLFYQFYAEISIFFIKKCSVQLLSTTSWCYARGRVTPPGIRRKYLEWVKIAENLVGNARMFSPNQWHTKVIKNGNSCFMLCSQIYREDLGLVNIYIESKEVMCHLTLNEILSYVTRKPLGFATS